MKKPTYLLPLCLPVCSLLLLAACNDKTKTDAPEANAPTTFALTVLPDTQMYARYRPSIFNAQTTWIADNAKALNIPMALHLGDVVDRWEEEKEWQAADAAMSILEKASVPYSVLAGNHDIIQEWDDKRPAGPYLKWFGAERAKKQKGFLAADPSGYNTAYTFEAQGNKYMVLALDWRVSDATLKWANELLKANPTLPTILTSHQIMNIGPDMVSAIDTAHGQRLWDGLIKDNDQIFLTLNGHHHGAANTVKKNAAGHDVQMMVVDYQSDYEGGNGMMRLLEFDVQGGKLNVMSFSPLVPKKDKAQLSQFDQAELTDSNNKFTWNINFKERFAGFNKDFKVPNQTPTTAITERVRQSFADFKPVSAAGKSATSESDYPAVEGTLAHWRFQGTQGQAAGNVADLSGKGNTLYRKSENGSTAQSIVYSADRPTLSAAQGSTCHYSEFRDKGEPVSFWETDSKAPLNTETFAGGYTLEAFIKIDSRFNADKNRWMGVITRNGDGNDIPKDFEYLDDRSEPLATLDVSNLRELHWAVAPQQLPKPATNELQTNWSWSIPTDKWVHVAVVNDAKTTRMYVDGAPVLRDADASILQKGMFSAGKTWIVGAKQSGGVARNAFSGCISEIRLVNRPLDKSQFLSARK